MSKRNVDPGALAYLEGTKAFWSHPLFEPFSQHLHIVRANQDRWAPEKGWAVVDSRGTIHVHPSARLESKQWLYVLAHCGLHVALGHVRAHSKPREWGAVCCMVVDRWLRDMKLGEPPPNYAAQERLPTNDEEHLLNWVLAEGIPKDLEEVGMAGPFRQDLLLLPETGAIVSRNGTPIDWSKCLATGLQACVEEAINTAGGFVHQSGGKRRVMSSAERARRWFVGAYPLMGAMAASFELVEDPRICHREEIRIAAVCPESREIFINPSAALGEEACRFVIAPELLHLGFRPVQRRESRDSLPRNVACDYVINGWLVEMNVGRLPEGTLYDPELKGLSAESVYDLIVRDLRRFRRLQTYRGEAVDVIERSNGWWEHGGGFDLDAFYRRALSEGLDLHQTNGRGYLPAGLIEEIRALSQPPIPWQVDLARWFDQFFPPVERRRTYARPSRRQSATPDIPRPRITTLEEAMLNRTFGVVLDTSGSMDRLTLAKGLGAITGYCLSREVPFVRLVFCDAMAYDEGYVAPEAIAGRVRVRGRGGTVLQPGIDLLQESIDFPKDGPILIITDGACDHLTIRRDHAFLMPPGASLPFAARGPIFRMK